MNLKYFLKNLPAFEEFKDADIDTLATHLEVAEVEDGHVFITQGVQGEALYMLLQGAVRLTRHDGEGGEEYEVRELADGELFGVLSLVDDFPASTTCIAKGKGTVAVLKRETFKQLFNDASPIGHHLHYMIAVQMARDIQDQNKRLRSGLSKA